MHAFILENYKIMDTNTKTRGKPLVINDFSQTHFVSQKEFVFTKRNQHIAFYKP
jgi:hypothetical protein